jgi:Uma2 family endonuclease
MGVADLSTEKASSLYFATEEEFVAWCEEDVRAEYVDGEVIVHSPASSQHERILMFVGTLITMFTSRHGLGTVLGSNTQVRLRPRLRRIPDLTFVAKGREDIILENHIEGAPDLVVEVVSPDSAARDWRDKYIEYEKYGVREYWVIDPANKRLEAYGRTEKGKFEIIPPDKKGHVHSEVLSGFWLRPEWLWQEKLPDVMELAKELKIV